MEPVRERTDAVEKVLELDTAPERVWRALTDPAELAAWFPDRVHGPEEGEEGWFVWDAHGRYAMRVLEADPPRRLVWSWARKADTALDAGPTTTVEWTLEGTPSGGTRLHLRESGFTTPEARADNDAGWDHELGELAAYLG